MNDEQAGIYCPWAAPLINHALSLLDAFARRICPRLARPIRHLLVNDAVVGLIR